MKSKHFGTLAIHGGQEPDPSTGAVMPPIYQTSTYAQSAPGKHKGYEYSRTRNPTRSALEASLASIENGSHAMGFASGLAAIDACMKLLSPGDEVISTNDLYGGAYRQFVNVYKKYGIKFHFLSMSQLDVIESKINKKTKMIWIESPTNPMLNIIDIERVSKIAKIAKALLVVDNTFATPYLQQPINLGADIVVHSGTKYLGGHSDIVLGAIIVNDSELAERLDYIRNATGGICGPMDSFLAIRGIKTLHLRMDRHCFNANIIAQFLESHPAVGRVIYPGLKTHPGHEIAKKQMRDFGGMVSFSVKSDRAKDASKVVSSMKIFTLAESLGGVESLSGHPASMTHASIPKKQREENGITEGLIRLSVGIEDVRDLKKDIKAALSLLL